MEFLGNLSQCVIDRAIKLTCIPCNVYWIGCADADECPRCGSTKSFEAYVEVQKLFR